MLKLNIRHLVETIVKNSGINEYLDSSYGMPLYKYLSRTDEEKLDEIVYNYAYKIPEFIQYAYDENIIDDNEYTSIVNYMKNHDEYDLAEELIGGELEHLKKPFMNHIEADMNNYIQDAPASYSFDKPEVFKNGWIIHFTEDAMSIAYDGFKHGTEEIDRLAYTGAGYTDGKKEGYNFGYDINDFDKFYLAYRGKPKYGSEAVLCQASGVKVWHYNDEEYQVIFWGPSAKNIIPIYNNNGYWKIMSMKTDNKIVEFEKLTDLVNWVMQNKEQYRKHLTYNKVKKENINMKKCVLNESEFKKVIAKIVSEALNEKIYGDSKNSAVSYKTGGYGGRNQDRGSRGRNDSIRGDKPEYYSGLPVPTETELYSPEKMKFFKAKHFGANADNVKSSLSLFQDIGEMGWEMNNLQSTTKGNIQWKAVTDDPEATVTPTGSIKGRHVFWLVKLPGDTDWRLFKVNMTKRYNSDYNPTTIKRVNR